MRRHHRVITAGALAVLVLVAVTSANFHGGTQPLAAPPFVVLPGTDAVPPTTATSPTAPTSPPSSTPPASPQERQQAQDVKQLSPIDSINELRAAAAAPALSIDADNHIRTVSTTPDKPLPPAPGSPATKDPATAAAAFVNRYGQGLGLVPGEHADVSRISAVPGGDKVVRLQQTIGGIPVIGGDLIVVVNPAGLVTTATAETPASIPSATGTATSAQTAAAKAIAAVADEAGAAASQFTAISSTLWYYDPRILRAPGKPEMRTTWRVEVGANDLGQVATVFVDASDGHVALVMSELRTAEDRSVCDLANASGLDIEGDPSTTVCSDAPGGPAVVRREGQGPVVSPADVNQAYDLLGATYDFYQTNFGRDSIDGKGLPLRATVRACEGSCPYANAFWNGTQMVFGPGFAGADDVVGHELTHGVTQYTSDLFYRAESGGINEAMSDIMGELIDQSRGSDDDSQWLLGEDLPGGAVRSMSNPPAFGQPEYVHGPNYDNHLNSSADNFGVHYLSGVVNKAAYLISHGGSLNSVTVTGIGKDKTAQIFYRLEFLMASGTEMSDLFTLLPDACRSILGVHGIALADCAQVALATQATNMGADLGTAAEANLCPQPGMSTRTFFYEDFEHGFGKWILDPVVWETLPAPDIPVTWANSGKNSLISDTFANSTSHEARTVGNVASPASGVNAESKIYLSWAENITTQFGGGVVRVFSAGSTGSQAESGATSFTNGWVRQSMPLATVVPGSDMSISLTPISPSQAGALNEWLVDDVTLYQCLTNVPGAPQFLVGQLSAGNTQAQLTWGAPTYQAPGNATTSYEITFLPAVPGLGGSVIVPAAQTTYTATGLNPAIRYGFSVRALGADGSPGAGTLVYLPTDLTFVCNAVTDVGGARVYQQCPGAPQIPR